MTNPTDPKAGAMRERETSLEDMRQQWERGKNLGSAQGYINALRAELEQERARADELERRNDEDIEEIGRLSRAYQTEMERANSAELSRDAAVAETIERAAKICDVAAEQRMPGFGTLALVAIDIRSLTPSAIREAVEAQRKFAQDFMAWYPNCAQLLDGWHADGTAWSEWDSTVRDGLRKLGDIAAKALK